MSPARSPRATAPTPGDADGSGATRGGCSGETEAAASRQAGRPRRDGGRSEGIHLHHRRRSIHVSPASETRTSKRLMPGSIWRSGVIQTMPPRAAWRCLRHPADGLLGDPEPDLLAVGVKLGPEPEGPVRAGRSRAAQVDQLAGPHEPRYTATITPGPPWQTRRPPPTGALHGSNRGLQDPWDIHAGEEAPSDDAKEKEAVAKRMRANWAERRKNAAK